MARQMGHKPSTCGADWSQLNNCVNTKKGYVLIQKNKFIDKNILIIFNIDYV